MIWDPHGVVLNANEAMARMVGTPWSVGRLAVEPDGAARPGGGSIPPEQLPAPRVERTHARVDLEFGLPHADGGHVWVSARSAPRPDGTIISAYTQITEAEAKARATARIATLVDDSPDLVWMFDAHGLIEYASPSFSATLGLRQDEVIGRLWRALTHPLDVPVLRAALADAGPDEPRTGIIEVRLRRRRHLGLGRGPGDPALPWRHGDRGRDYRPRREPHARRRGRRPPARRAAQGARRRRALRHLDGRPDRPHRGRQRAGVLAAGPHPSAPRSSIGRDTNVILSAMERLVAAPERRRRAAARGRADGRDRALRRGPTAPTDAGSATTTSRSARTAPPAGCGSFRDITQFKLQDEEQQRVPGDDEPRDQDAAVGHRGRGRAALQRRAAGDPSASWRS